jgi:hypothetical protein
MAVIGKGTVIHFGISAESRSLNEAINYIPESWLVEGLPSVRRDVAHHLQKTAIYWWNLMHPAPDAETGPWPQYHPHHWLTDKHFAETTAQMLPRDWILDHIKDYLMVDLKRATNYIDAPQEVKDDPQRCPPQSIFPYTLDGQQLNDAYTDCDIICSILDTTEVNDWLEWINEE